MPGKDRFINYINLVDSYGFIEMQNFLKNSESDIFRHN
jgi:hypothetical protein